MIHLLCWLSSSVYEFIAMTSAFGSLTFDINIIISTVQINQILIEIKVNLTYSKEFIVKNKSGYDQSFIYVMNERDRL